MVQQGLTGGKPIVAITMGDVAGIGPEILVRAVQSHPLNDRCLPLIIGHPLLLQRAADLFELPCQVKLITQIPQAPQELRRLLTEASLRGAVCCWNPAGDDVLNAPAGRVSAAAGEGAFQYLSEAIRLAQTALVDAIATAPLNKESLHLAGHHYPGHTEILAEQCGRREFAMMLHLPESRLSPIRDLIRLPDEAKPVAAPAVSGCGLSIAHVTLHTSVKSVPDLLTVEGIVEKTTLVHDFLAQLGCQRKAIAVCALNPHAGENGLFGDEEARIIEPAVRAARRQGVHVVGPLPVDTLMRRAMGGEFDGVVAMYHDQGHIPVKLIGFDAAVNITLGLPIIRTSPTHGTAFDRAWKADTPSDASGMCEAVLMAAQLTRTASCV